MAAPNPSPEAEEAKPFNRRLIPLIAGATALLVYGGYRLYQWRQPYEWSGTVEARTISVGSRAGGRVKSVAVHEGDLVQAGQPIVELEPGDLKAQLLAARGAVDQAQANLDKLIERRPARGDSGGAGRARRPPRRRWPRAAPAPAWSRFAARGRACCRRRWRSTRRSSTRTA